MQPSNDNPLFTKQVLTQRQLTKMQSLKKQMSLEHLALEYWGIEYARIEYGHPLDTKTMVRDCKESVESQFADKLKSQDFLNLMLSVHFGIEASKIRDCEYVESYDPRFGDHWILSFDTDSEVLTDILNEDIEQGKNSSEADDGSDSLNTFVSQADAYEHANQNFNLFERYCNKMHISTDAAFEVLRG